MGVGIPARYLEMHKLALSYSFTRSCFSPIVARISHSIAKARTQPQALAKLLRIIKLGAETCGVIERKAGNLLAVPRGLRSRDEEQLVRLRDHGNQTTDVLQYLVAGKEKGDCA